MKIQRLRLQNYITELVVLAAPAKNLVRKKRHSSKDFMRAWDREKRVRTLERAKDGICKTQDATSVADVDPGSSAFLTPGSGIRDPTGMGKNQDPETGWTARIIFPRP